MKVDSCARAFVATVKEFTLLEGWKETQSIHLVRTQPIIKEITKQQQQTKK